MDENAAVVRGVYEALANGDVSTLLNVLDSHVEWHEAEHVTYWPGGPFVGPQAVLEGVLARIPKDFDGLIIDVKRIVSCGSTVVVEARYRAPVRATGMLLDAQVAHIWDFRDGKVVRWQQYTDTWQFAQVMGVEPVQ
jgi:ketosteroid isomerase-like protein